MSRIQTPFGTDWVANWQGGAGGYGGGKREPIPKLKELTLSQLASGLAFKKRLNFPGGPVIQVGVFNADYEIVAVVSAILNDKGEFIVSNISAVSNQAESTIVADTSQGTSATVDEVDQADAYNKLLPKESRMSW